MSVKIKIVSLALLCALCLSLCACAVRLDPPRELTSEEEAVNMGFSKAEHNGVIRVGEYEFLKVNIKLDYEQEVNWSSKDPEVAVVDSRGRVDALKEGKTVVTAKAKSATVDYEIEVTKAKKSTTSYSTAITSNAEVLERNIALGTERKLYALIINEYDCVVTAFTYGADGEYTHPVRAMACSTTKNPKAIRDEKDRLSWVKYQLTDKAESVYLSDGNYYRYASYIGEDFMFQSAPYKSESADSLIAEEYNKIGTPSTSKNIRLSVADAKWIYDNCDEGTMVRIVNASNTSLYSPLGVPESMKLTESSKSLKYDPTDTDKGNPYLKLKPIISGAEDITIEAQKGFDLYSGVTAVDTCSNDITDKITIEGDFDRNVEGRYIVTYYATDAMGRTARVDREITVVDKLDK